MVHLTKTEALEILKKAEEVIRNYPKEELIGEHEGLEFQFMEQVGTINLVNNKNAVNITIRHQELKEEIL